MTTGGWRDQFLARPWNEVAEFLDGVQWGSPRPRYLFDIIESVEVSGAKDLLAVTTSMHDLVVAPIPVDDPPLDVIVVRALGSLRAPPAGFVRIDHVAVSGRDTVIRRPTSEAVLLFWRFVDTEFGIGPSAKA